MDRNELYMRLDTIKLALESSAVLLGQYKILESKDGVAERTISPENIKSINTTIHSAERMLRQIMSEELNTIKDNDKEEDD